jgi:PAS domain S-box-containing protein
MLNFFDKVIKNIDKLDSFSIREQFARMVKEMRFFETVFQTLDEGVLVISSDGRLLYANHAAEKLTSITLSKSRDKLIAKIMPDWDWVSLLGENTNTDGWLRKAEREIEIAYPEPKILSISVLPSEENITVAIIRDVTTEREREASVLESGRADAVRELASGVAHEIGNPLNALSLNLQLLAREFKKEPDKERRDRLLADIDIALNQVKRISGINQGFLNALRPIKPNLIPGNLADPLKCTLAELKTQLENRSIHVMVNLPSALPSVMIDSAQIQQVFFNLIKNALEVIKDGSEIEIALSSDDDYVFASFRDSGSGMDGETLAALFEPYKTSKKSGNGLGLMVSRRIVRAHGGEIDVESKEGVGTRFIVSIPRIEKRVRRLT